MPPPSVPEDQRPNDDEVDVLWRWIESCIGEQLGCGQGDDFISSDEMLSVMRNDISNTAEISPDEREFIRYFTLTHLYNSGICGEDLEVYRYALFKLINSLSTGNKVVLPVAAQAQARSEEDRYVDGHRAPWRGLSQPARG